jgi:hypothetical protein
MDVTDICWNCGSDKVEITHFCINCERNEQFCVCEEKTFWDHWVCLSCGATW